MEAINAFFAANRPLIYFIGGLSFFSMGLTSMLQRRRYSRLRLARWVGFLVWFGILYGANEWANLLVPVQDRLPIAASAGRLAVAQLLIRGVALALLFQFGIELLRPPFARLGWVRWIPGVFALLWVTALAYFCVVLHAPVEMLFSTGDLLARYFLGIPAAVLSCLGLLEQRREVREAGFPQIARYLLGAAASLGVFGLVGVLLAVSGPFFPGDWLAYPFVLYLIGVFVPILRAVDGVAMALFTARALEVFEAETDAIIAEIERRNVLLADRERISRELHDGTIQALYAAGLRLEDAYHTIAEAPAQAQEKVRAVMEDLNRVIQEIRAYIFDLQDRQLGSDLVHRLASLIQELRLDTMLECEFLVQGRPCAPSAERIGHLYQIVQEALSNVVRHARAAHVAVRLSFEGERLRLEVEDDGCGFDPEAVMQSGCGMGLRHITERVRLLGGEVRVVSRPGAGTRIEVVVPCPCDEWEQEVVDDGRRALASARGR